MLLLSILLLPVVLGADRERHFGRYVVKINEDNILTNVERTNTDRYVFELNLSNLGLESIDPNAFDNVTDIRSLNLTNNWLTTLPKYVFSKLTTLQHLSLAENNISSLDSVFIGLRSLRSLDLSNNTFEQIGAGYLYGLNEDVDIWTKGNVFSNISTFLFGKPGNPPEKTIRENETEDITSLTNVPSSNLSENEICTKNYWSEKLQIRLYSDYEFPSVDCTIVGVNHTNLRLYIPHSVGRVRWDTILSEIPENIVGVNLSNNAIVFPPEKQIDGLNHLRSLILDDCSIYSIEDNFFAETNLSVLSLNQNDLQNIAFAKTLPTCLEEIRLNNNRIRVIPLGSFSGLKNLIKLGLSHNDLRDIETFSFSGLENLVELDLSANILQYIETGMFSELKNLVKLDLSHNGLQDIETGTFRNLEALRELNLYGNRIHIYKGIFAGLESIEYLNIGRNELEETKNILFAMPDTLETVILDDNKINSLEVGSLVRVPKRKLSLKGNNIGSFVEGSFDLSSLEELDLSYNQLSQLTRSSFYGLASVERLSLAGNRITTLNNGDLEILDKLEILDLSLNPIKSLGRGALRGMVMSERSVVFLAGVPIEGIHNPFYIY